MDHVTKPIDEMLNMATGDTKFGGTVNILDNHYMKANLNLVRMLGQIL